MTVEKLFPSGAYIVSDVIDGWLVTKKYYGYSKRGALRMFKQEYYQKRK